MQLPEGGTEGVPMIHGKPAVWIDDATYCNSQMLLTYGTRYLTVLASERGRALDPGCQ